MLYVPIDFCLIIYLFSISLRKILNTSQDTFIIHLVSTIYHILNVCMSLNKKNNSETGKCFVRKMFNCNTNELSASFPFQQNLTALSQCQNGFLCSICAYRKFVNASSGSLSLHKEHMECDTVQNLHQLTLKKKQRKKRKFNIDKV